MAEIFAGCTLERLPHAKGGRSPRFFEYAPKGPLPTLATLARVAKQLPKPLACALVCPRSTWLTPKGPLRPGPELTSGLDWIKRVADILSARAIVIATGAELTTGERDRNLLAAFAEQLKSTGRLIVVAPRGLWEAEHGAAFAAQTGTVYGFDPLEDDAPKAAVVYARVRPMGARPRLTEGHLAQIAERLLAVDAETVYVAIESAQAARDAKRMHAALEEQGELLAADDESDEDDGSDEDGRSDESSSDEGEDADDDDADDADDDEGEGDGDDADGEDADDDNDDDDDDD
jgi:hypothetical protein